jgi:hypothetical protein
MQLGNLFRGHTGVHLGKDIAAPLGEYLQGVGGGHAKSNKETLFLLRKT